MIPVGWLLLGANAGMVFAAAALLDAGGKSWFGYPILAASLTGAVSIAHRLGQLR